MGHLFKLLSFIYIIAVVIVAIIDSKFNYGFNFYKGYYWISNIGITFILFGVGHLMLQLDRIKK